ncbi:unnamed protein product [Arabis nemorensis]|uniref:2-(3-amino-3-carboxypropyl)histidine synthase subunit 1 n=1 Tax=Arabis nemorensis TaxID=586526 RepID=A0A565CN62_9BRAS|nr:unnamed protein product [Arabis nemorensis]
MDCVFVAAGSECVNAAILILGDASLNATISLLPSIYQFDVHKCIWGIKSINAKRIALQLPEGLLIYALTLSDIFTFLGLCACDVKNIILTGTIQFTSAIRAVKPDLEKQGFSVLIPMSKPLSASEVLGCITPKIPTVEDRKDAFMITNSKIKAFRYYPYFSKLVLEEYGHKGMRETRRRAIARDKVAKTWGIMLGTFRRKGNPKIFERLEKKMMEKGLNRTVVIMLELSPIRVALFVLVLLR